jgi:multiple sugar transport system substrate-binding protein
VVWGPNVNTTYQSYQDAFGQAITRGSPFGAAVDTMQAATVADLRKNGFKVAG